jgi:hypothetical protein
MLEINKSINKAHRQNQSMCFIYNIYIKIKKYCRHEKPNTLKYK